MKKVLFALLGAVAIVLASCNPLTVGVKGSSLTAEKVANMDNKTEKCWHLAETYTVDSKKVQEDGYIWGTEFEIASAAFVAYQGGKILFSDYDNAYMPASAKDADACAKLAEEAAKDAADDLTK